MKITREFLKSKNPCTDGYKWWCENCEGLSNRDQILKLAEDHNDWANWLIVRIMTYKQYVSYAVYSTELVIDIFEKKYPNDKRPRLAIEAAKKCIDNPSKENKASASAASAASASASAAYSAAASAAYAAAASYDAAYDAKKEIQTKIINYGLELINLTN